jgi:hypothetical protein
VNFLKINYEEPTSPLLRPPYAIDNASEIVETIQNSPSNHKTLKHYFNQMHLIYHNKLNVVDH